MTAPELVTGRLVLRAHTIADFPDSAAMWSDETVVRFIGGRPATEEEVWARVLRYGGLWSLLGFGYWVVRDQATNRFVGEVGFADFHRDLVPPLGGVAEAGWALAPWAHGRGFATEALGAALQWADAELPALKGSARTVCLISPENTASIRVAEKCGYQVAEPAMYKGSPTVIHERRGPAQSELPCHPERA